MVGIDPATGKLVDGGVAVETKRVLDNLSSVLSAAGSSLASLVKTTIYLTEIGDFGAVNAVYGQYVGSPPPARATVAVAALPAGSHVEIDAIAKHG